MLPDPFTAAAAAVGRVSARVTLPLPGQRPDGGVRVAGKEDRAQAYLQFHDAAARYAQAAQFLQQFRAASGRAPFADKVLADTMEATTLLAAVLAGVRARGTLRMVVAAQDVSVRNLVVDPEYFAKAAEGFHAALDRYTAALRSELGYGPRWWQPVRRLKERDLARRSDRLSRYAALQRRMGRHLRPLAGRGGSGGDAAA